MNEDRTQTPTVRDHLFVSGNPAYGWERQCSAKVAVVEQGQVVGVCCGYPPEEHVSAEA